MKKVLLIFTVFIIISCTGENNSKTTIQNELESEKDLMIDQINKELILSESNLEILSKDLKVLQSKFDKSIIENSILSEQIDKLLEEKLLLEMSLKNLRTQYEQTQIEKSIENKNIK